MSHYPKPKKQPKKEEIARSGRSPVDDPAVWVQFVRASQGWTQEEFAEAARMHPAQISAYETGRKIPRPATRAKLAAAAGTTPDAVIEAAEVLRRRAPSGGALTSRRAASFADQTRRQVEAALERAALLLAPGR